MLKKVEKTTHTFYLTNTFIKRGEYIFIYASICIYGICTCLMWITRYNPKKFQSKIME